LPPSSLSFINGLTDCLRFLQSLTARRSVPAADNLFLRKQLAFYQEHQIRLRRLTATARFSLLFWSRFCDWRNALVIVKPETLIGWHSAAWSRTQFLRTTAQSLGSHLIPRHCQYLSFWHRVIGSIRPRTARTNTGAPCRISTNRAANIGLNWLGSTAHPVQGQEPTAKCSWTANRQRAAIPCFREALRLTKSKWNVEQAVQLPLHAIDNLAARDFHMGLNPKTGGAKYSDWEHVFGSMDKFKKWIGIKWCRPLSLPAFLPAPAPESHWSSHQFFEQIAVISVSMLLDASVLSRH
jgi:hypothetical protein